ncbi:aldehyde oxidase [Sulfodiicoccus acidiphilus]|uniref:Aldehyde oxidase n=1 Tax=Sulfodiicoccus acidiphilus TaxID=1670455 RepID=A0A348B3V3_9CREN|nr:glyceraldehyde dehydrogenase subunit alpha [Sulfodiicoccus acidiphilus]BBD72855.1 aldehyde oxidase [Sulfodiicoccus acidiphilus]GGT88455.1 aldehyde oxidase [Sulfodiicoccus acidiphilus]
MTYVGKPIKRVFDPRLITGRQNYIDDINFQGLHAAFVRSPYPHARVRSIDASDAVKSKGVVAVFTKRDLGLKEPMRPWVTYIDTSHLKDAPRYIFHDTVKYVGEPVAVVLATDRYLARDAVEKVNVDYEELKAVTKMEDAVKDEVLVHPNLGTNVAYDSNFNAGNVERAFKEAEVVVPIEIANERLSPSPMEPRGIVSRYESGYLTVWASTQIPHILRNEFSRMLGLESSKIRVIMPDIGGAFGSKAHIIPEELAVIAASMKLNSTVKWVATRSEELLASTARHNHFVGEVALKRDGTLLGIRGTLDVEMGAYITYTSMIQPQIIPPMIPGPYKVKDLAIRSRAVYTNTPPITMYRGASRPEATFIIERIMSIAADELKMSDVDIRLRNLVPPDLMPYKNPFGLQYDTGDYPGLLKKAIEKLEYERLIKWAEEEKKRGHRVGVGMAFYLEICGFGPWEYAEVRIDENGNVSVITGATPHGQGTETGIAQIVADELGVDMERVTVIWGDTAIVPAGFGTYGSRTISLAGSAAALASRKVMDKMKRVAASMLGVENVDYKDGKFTAAGKSVGWNEVAKKAYEVKDPGLVAYQFYEANVTFPYGVGVAIVEVDDYGIPKVLKYLSYDDIGKVVNPLLAEGQVHGAVVQAVGQALYEEAKLDENGQLVVSFSDYFIPTFMEAPEIKSQFTDTPHDSPYVTKSKGIGEAGLIVGPAVVVRALENATGARFTKTPVRPEEIFEKIKTK